MQWIREPLAKHHQHLDLRFLSGDGKKRSSTERAGIEGWTKVRSLHILQGRSQVFHILE